MVCARARAFGQFEAPYDPDFAPSSAQEQRQAEQLGPRAPSAAPACAPFMVMPPGMRFLLLQRPNPARIFEVPPSTAAVAVSSAPAFETFEETLNPLQYTARRYNRMVKDVEQGIAPEEEQRGVVPYISAAPEVAVSTTSAKPPPPEVELPTYGTSLSVTGRKVIGVNYSEKRYTADQSSVGRQQTTNLIDIQQQLQLRMQGKVGPKITVNVDYDDTKVNHQDISVVYTGDPNEIVQNVSFGDIDLSLPPTEFVSYNKQLFGIRADIKYKGWSATVIGSRTKGTTKSKQFFGNSQFVAEDLLDTSYIRYTYYDLTFGNPARLPIKSGTEKVYLSTNQNGAVNANNILITASDLNNNEIPSLPAPQPSSATYTGNFIQLNPGIDYTMDYVNGVITFRNPLQAGYVVAIDFVDNSGNELAVETSSGSTTPTTPACVEPVGVEQGARSGQPCPILIKTPSDVPINISTDVEVGYNREEKTWYNLGQQQIVRDNGRGNFILQVLDQNRNLVGPDLTPPQAYPTSFFVNFEQGVFELLQPFGVLVSSGVGQPTVTEPDPQIYALTPISKRVIHAEFSYRFKTFFLEPNLVPESEVVLLDGVKLNRNVDYFIDYEAGFLTFFNPDRIGSNSEIDITYEVAPFAGISDTSLLGTRVGYQFNKHVDVGATMLYQTGTKDQTTPQITELAQSLLVYDANSNVKDVQLAKNVKLTDLSVEAAQSREDMNLNQFAIIDNMEGVSNETTASTQFTQWFVASQPGSAGLSDGLPDNVNDYSLVTESIQTLLINPNSQATPQDTTPALDVSYTLPHVGDEVSIVFPFSQTGDDFSQSTILNVVMLGDVSSNELNFRLGGIAEDADNTGGMTLNCADGRVLTHAPKTEDVNCNGILDPGEDIGWLFAPTQCVDGPPNYVTPCPSMSFGANNGRIDTEDLNGNGVLDPDDGNGNNFGAFSPGDFPDLTGANPTNNEMYSITSGDTSTSIDFGTYPNGNPDPNGQKNGWQTFQIPLNISTNSITRWQAIKDVRITIKRTAGGASTGILKFAHIGVLGNTWLAGQPVDPSINNNPVSPPSGNYPSESLLITPVNNVNDSSYVPIYNAGGDAEQVFNDLYGSVSNLQKQSNTQNIQEQSLQLKFDNMTIQPSLYGIGLASATVTTKRQFPQAIDISQHRYFNFLIFGNANFAAGTPCGGSGAGAEPSVGGSPNCTDHTFFLRVGDDNDFYEVDVPINFVGWKEISVRQVDSAHNNVADHWVADTVGTVVVSSGAPSLQNVGEIVAGVRRTGTASNPATTPTGGVVWLDEIHMAVPMQRVGNAAKIGFDFEVPGWATFGAKYRMVDRNFQTPTSVVSNQDNEQDSSYMNFTRFKYFPMTFNVSRVLTNTPSTFNTGNLSNSVNLLQQGKVDNWTGTAQGNFTMGALPRVNLNYTRNYINYQLLTRTDDKNSYNVTVQYGVPVARSWLPRTLDFTGGYTTYDTNYGAYNVLEQAGNYDTHDKTTSGALKLAFVPWQGASFNPNYSLTKVDEKRQDFTTGAELDSAYPVSRSQTVGFTSNFRITNWLNPQANYSIDTLENNILNVSTFVVANSTYVFNPGDIKTINRSANGAITVPLTMSQIFPNVRMLHSMTIVSGYQLNDGDVWNNVENSLNSLTHLWIRSGLNPKNPAAVLQNRTERDTYNSTMRWSPLDSFDLRGRWAPLKTLSISNNFIESVQNSWTTGTQAKTVALTLPDSVTSISQLEQLFGTQRWMSNTQVNLRYAAHQTSNVGLSEATDDNIGMDFRSIIKRRFDSLFSFNVRDSQNTDLLVGANTQSTAHRDATLQTTFDVGHYRFTPKTDYTYDMTELGTGVKTQEVTVITPSVLMRADLSLPRGLLIPGTTHAILFTNRIIWTTTASMAFRKSPVTQIDNFKLFSLTSSADYELAKNLRMTINAALSREWHDYLPTEDFISYQFGSTMTFQF